MLSTFLGLAFLAGPAIGALAVTEHTTLATPTEAEHNVHNRDWSTTSFSGSDSLVTVYAVSSFIVTTTETDTNHSLVQTTTRTYSSDLESYLTTVTVASPPTPVAPYAQGNCNLHLTEWTDVTATNKSHSFEVTMWDNDRQHQIGYAKATGFGGGDPFSVDSKLEDRLVVTQIYPLNLQPEYIRFVLGAQTWASTDKLHDHIPGCNLGGWDGSNNPSYRQVDCSYACIWAGGTASNRS